MFLPVRSWIPSPTARRPVAPLGQLTLGQYLFCTSLCHLSQHEFALVLPEICLVNGSCRNLQCTLFCYCPFNAAQRGRERAIKLTKTLENVLGRLIALKMGYKYNVPLLTHHYYGHHYYGHLLVLVTALELHLCIGVKDSSIQHSPITINIL